MTFFSRTALLAIAVLAIVSTAHAQTRSNYVPPTPAGIATHNARASAAYACYIGGRYITGYECPEARATTRTPRPVINIPGFPTY